MQKWAIPGVTLFTVAVAACVSSPEHPAVPPQAAWMATIASCEAPNICLMPDEPPGLVAGPRNAVSELTARGYRLATDGSVTSRFAQDYCEPDFSAFDFAAFTVDVSIDAGEADVHLGIAAFTAEGEPNGNMAVRLFRDGEPHRYTAMIPLLPGTECITVIAALSVGAFELVARDPTVRLFPNDDPFPFPALGPDNAWYAQKILYDYIRADALHPSHVEFARPTIGAAAADALLAGIDAGEDAATLFEIAVTAPAHRDVVHDFAAAHGPYFLERATRRERLPGLRSVDFSWDWGYVALAAAVAFERTNDPRLGALVLEQFETALAWRDSELGIEDGYLGHSLPAWGEQRPGDPLWWVSVTHAGMITYPMMKVLAHVERNSAEFGDVFGDGADAERLRALLKERRDRYLDAFEAAVVALDAVARRTESGGLYYIANGAGGVVEAVNHTHPLAAGMLLHAEMTGDAGMRARAEGVAQFFIDSLVELETGGCAYPYAPSPGRMTDYRGDPENVWKANITLLFLVEAARRGEFFDDRHFQCLSHAIIENVLDLPADPNTVFWPESGARFSQLEAAAATEAPALGMFTLFGEFDPQIKAKTVEMVAANPVLFPDGWLHRVMMVGYAGRLDDGDR